MTDLDDLIARQRHVVDLHEAGLLEPMPSAQTAYEQDKAILARLVSLRDAQKELPDSEEMTRVLRSFGEAYPEDIFGPVTEDEQKQYGNLITRNSAAMGRHCAKFMAQAADHIDALRAHAVADRARLKELETSHALGWAVGECPSCGEVIATGDAVKRAESAESRVRALEAEREAMMAKLREPTEEMWDAAWNSIKVPDLDRARKVLSVHEIRLMWAAFHKAMTAAMGGE